jgi:hypothetical protein
MYHSHKLLEDETDRKIFMKNQLIGSGAIVAYRRTDGTVLIIAPQ